jgi:hypothetical protein
MVAVWVFAEGCWMRTVAGDGRKGLAFEAEIRDEEPASWMTLLAG